MADEPIAAYDPGLEGLFAGRLWAELDDVAVPIDHVEARSRHS